MAGLQRRQFVGATSAFVALTIAGCRGGEKAAFPETVNIAMQTWIGYGYAVIAKEKGFFGDMPVTMSVVEDGTALAGGLSGGATQIIGSTLDQFMLLRSNNVPGQLLALTDDSYGGDGMAVTSAIKSLADVRGKRVAYTPGPSSEYVLATALKSAGMTLDDVVPVTFPDPSGTVSAFVNGQVDAAVIFQPYLGQTLSRPDSRLLFTTKEFPDISVGCFVIREGLANGNDIAKRFIEGVSKAENWVKQNAAEADAILTKFFNVDEKALNDMRAGARLKGAAENARYFGAGGSTPPVLKMLQEIDAHYQSRGVAGSRRASAADIYPTAARDFAGG